MIKLPKKKYTPKQDVQLGQIAGAVGGAVVGGELGRYIAEGTQFGLGTLLLRSSRDYEKRADLLGAQIMARAGDEPVPSSQTDPHDSFVLVLVVASPCVTGRIQSAERTEVHPLNCR